MAGLIFGIFRAGLVVRDQKIVTSYLGRDVIINATVADIPEYKDNRTNLKLSDIYLNYNTSVLKCQIYIILSGERKDISRSDHITLKGQLNSGFGNYIASLYRPQITNISKPDPPDFALHFRSSFTNRVRQQVSDSEVANLALGFLVGEKTLSEDLKNQLRIVGLSHIVVASGYCLSILVNFAKKIMSRISRLVAYLSAMLLIIVFITITGLSPSLMRAGLVSGLVLLAGFFGRKFHPIRLLIYVTTISIVIEPTIITNLAWQLSLASYAGIMLVSPLLKTFFYGNNKPSALAELLFATISAQTFCAPISIRTFGYFSVISFISNILITPAIPLVMTLTVVIGITSSAIMPILALQKAVVSFQLATIHRLSLIK